MCVFIYIDDQLRYYLRTKPSDVFAFEEMLFIWAVHRRLQVMVTSRYFTCRISFHCFTVGHALDVYDRCFVNDIWHL